MHIDRMDDLHKIFKNFSQPGDMALEKNRLATFREWVFDDSQKCNVKALAEAGFYFSGTKLEPDSVTCFLCGKSLDCWDSDDDPFVEHRKHQTSCMFAINNKTENEYSFQDYLDLVTNHWRQTVGLIKDDLKKSFSKNIKSLLISNNK